MKFITKLLALTLMVSTLLCSCGAGNPYFCDPLEAQATGFNLMVTPKPELMTVLSVLSGENADSVNREETIYRNDIFTRFKKFKDHPMVNYYREKELDHDIMCEFSMMINKNFSLDPKFLHFQDDDRCTENEKRILSAVSEKCDLEELLENLKKFHEDTNMYSFFKRNKNTFKDMLKDISEELDKYKVSEFTNKYFGENENNYRIILQPIRTTPVTSETSVSIMDEEANVHYVSYTNVFTGLYQRKYFSPDIVKEISADILNPILENYNDEINKYNSLLKDMPNTPKEAGYDTWPAAFEKQLMDGIAARFILFAWGEEEYNTYVQQNQDWGLIYQKDICDKLAEFEANPEKYPTLESFIPEIFTCLDKYLD